MKLLHVQYVTNYKKITFRLHNLNWRMRDLNLKIIQKVKVFILNVILVIHSSIMKILCYIKLAWNIPRHGIREHIKNENSLSNFKSPKHCRKELGQEFSMRFHNVHTIWTWKTIWIFLRWFYNTKYIKLVIAINLLYSYNYYNNIRCVF